MPAQGTNPVCVLLLASLLALRCDVRVVVFSSFIYTEPVLPFQTTTGASYLIYTTARVLTTLMYGLQATFYKQNKRVRK